MPGFPPMGQMNPANAEAMEAAGEQLTPQQQMMIQALRQQAMQGGAGGPGGGLPPGQGAPGAPAISPAAPGGMSQADFSGYGRGGVTPPDAQAAKAAQHIQLLRLLARQQQGGYGQ